MQLNIQDQEARRILDVAGQRGWGDWYYILVKTYDHFCNTYSLQTFNCKTTVKILIHIKKVKNANNFGIVRNSKRTRKNTPANIKKYSSWKSGLQLILKLTKSLFSRLRGSCRRIFFYDFFKDTNTV